MVVPAKVLLDDRRFSCSRRADEHHKPPPTHELVHDVRHHDSVAGAHGQLTKGRLARSHSNGDGLKLGNLRP